MDNSCLESYRIEGVHIWDLFDVFLMHRLAWGGMLEFGSDASLRNACDCLLFQILLFEIDI